MTPSSLAATLGFIALTAPLAALGVLACSLLFTRGMTERRIHQVVAAGLITGLIASLVVGFTLLLGVAPAEVELANVIAIRGYHLDLAFRLDGPAVVLLTLDLLLCGLVGLFSASYLHQDEGYQRFYVLLMLFSVGVSFIATARGLDLLFAGWELVGLTSALLIAFFHRRPSPVAHGLRAFAVYRTTDVGLLLGLVLLHHSLGTTDLQAAAAHLDASPALILIGALFVFGAMGKGASLPFTGWLPRAMEGPTPSSAIFYGALSIHASPFLLLRVQPLLDSHIGLRVAVVGIGLLTALHASMVGRAQTDIKSSLGYASVTQVGIIWAWAGLGLETLALVHIVGHAALRTRQLLRAPSLLHERYQLKSLMGGDLAHTGRHIEALVPAGLRSRLYVLALERWYLDELLEELVRSLSVPLRALDRLDTAWAQLLDGQTEDAGVEVPHEAKTR